MSTESIDDRFRTLRRALRGNSAFSAASGLVLLVAARPLASFIGLDAPLALVVLGVILILYAGWLFWVASQESIDSRYGMTAVILDVAWVGGSALILLGGWPPLTVAGKWTVALLAEVVAVFAVWQAVGLRRARHRG